MWLGQGTPPQGRGGICTLTYKQGMYTRLPTITSMNSSGEQSSRKSTSALKISEGLGLRVQCSLAALVPSQPIRNRLGGPLCSQGFTRV